jgi:hypothetical protein
VYGSLKHLTLRVAIVFIAIAAPLALSAVVLARPGEPDPLAAALERARAAGSYDFTSDITQVSVPTSKVTNVGRTSRTDRFHLEGQSNLAARSLQMHMWSGDGSVANPDSGVAVKIEDGKTYVRSGQDPWKEREGLLDSFAPEGDFMAFLAAMRDLVAHPAETRSGITFTRYSFTLDGPALAALVRDQAEAALRRRGELAPGGTTELSPYYRDMVGSGELWIGSEGLPLREILRMRFPERDDDVVRAEIVTTFSAFGQAAGPRAATGSRWVAQAFAAFGRWLSAAAGWLALLAGLAFWLIWPHRRRLQPLLIVTLVIMMVATPILRDLRMADAATAVAERAQTLKQEQEESREAQEARASLAQTRIDPHADPLLETPTPTAEPADVRTSPPEDTAPIEPSGNPNDDPDHDGLTNLQEAQVGTDPDRPDTDEDGISDGVEVRGFTLTGPSGAGSWYMDPNNVDSNADQVADGVEYDLNRDGRPDDTDQDGVPDVFDTDNDGDGVPDGKDLSPFTLMAYGAASPMRLKVDNLAPGIPTFVDFQLRPADQEHLWYAYNVLDWPTDDAAQIRDVDGKTFADLGEADSAANAGDGDVKLIPMLEIRIPQGANLPPEEDLKPYNISVTEPSPGSGDRMAYVPLSIITDEATGARVAFNGRMRYLPGNNWGQAHEFRLAWLVQVLDDIPCDYQARERPEGCTEDNHIHNVRQVVQRYEEVWMLTGLNVKEDRGTRVALIYEDPAADPDPLQDEALTALAVGLDQTFLSGRDQAGANGQPDGRRDVDLSEIGRRFDRLSNSGVGEVERWAVPNVLRVQTADYLTLDQAVMASGPAGATVLNAEFGPKWKGDNRIKPLLMYAQEMRSRAIGLDALVDPNGSAVRDDSQQQITLNFAPGGTPVAVLTTTGLKWTPYCAPAAQTPSWAPCAPDDWWETQRERYPGVLPGDPDDPDFALGRQTISQVFALTLMQGVSRIVERDTRILSAPFGVKTDPELAETVRTGLGLVKAAVVFLTNNALLAQLQGTDSIGRIGRLMRGVYQGIGLAKIMEMLGKASIGWKIIGYTALAVAGVAVLAGIATIVYFASQGALWAKIVVKSVVWLVTAYLGIISPIQTIRGWLQAMSAAGVTAETAQIHSEVLGNTRAGAWVGMVIALLITWGFFIYSVIANDVEAFSPEFNDALAETLASTIYIVLMTLLMSNPVGAIIGAILAAVDAIFTAICELGVDKLRDAPWMDKACFTISGSLVKLIAYTIRTFQPMVDLKRTDLMVTGPLNAALSSPDLGYVEGQGIKLSMPVTTTVVHEKPNPKNGLLIYPYGWSFYSDDNIRTSTFGYSFTKEQEKLRVARDTMKPLWTVEPDHKWGAIQMYRARWATTAETKTPVELKAGLNQVFAPWFNMGYAVPAYECWGLLILGVCYRRTLSGNTSKQLDAIQYDVLPASVGGFMTLTPRGADKYGLAWDERFPALADADGDGLRSGSADPNDRLWDTDGDGLSDTYELEKRQAGVAYSPTDCDADRDGLTDAEEARRHTAPDTPDTDGDGLLDGEEVYHRVYSYDAMSKTCIPQAAMSGGWFIEISGLGPIRVESDPTMADTDGDGVDDLGERDLANDANPAHRTDYDGHVFHPRVANKPWIEITPTTAPLYVRPGAEAAYTTTVLTRVALQASSTLQVIPSDTRLISPAPVDPVPLPFDPASFSGEQTRVQAHRLWVSPAALDQDVWVRSKVSGQPARDDGPLGPGAYVMWAGLSVHIDGTPPASQVVPNAQWVKGDGDNLVTIIIGGNASDNKAGVAKVEVSVNGGPWEVAEGTNTWTYALVGKDGGYRIETRATDGAGNVETPQGVAAVNIDGRPPVFSVAENGGGSSQPWRSAHGQVDEQLGGGEWTRRLSGEVLDQWPGSGLDEASAQVRLRSDYRYVPDEQNMPVVGEWQPVTLTWDPQINTYAWTVDYRLPADVADPTGDWTVEMRAVDKVGNAVETNKDDIYVDAQGPVVSLNEDVVVRPMMGGTMSLAGVVASNDRSGVNQVEASFVPIQEVALLGDAALYFPFEEPETWRYWQDRSDQGIAARCGNAVLTCPHTVEGRVGRGILLEMGFPEGYPSLVVDPHFYDAKIAETGMTVMVWVKVTDEVVIMDGGTEGWQWRIGVHWDGRARLTFGDRHGDGEYFFDDPLIGPAVDDGNWHHLAGTYDPQQGVESLYVDGQLAGQKAATWLAQLESTWSIIGSRPPEPATIDELIVLQHAASADEVQTLYRAADRPWYGATIDWNSGHPYPWSLALPPDLEGVYQVDLRTEDGFPNEPLYANVWRGSIDTLAPRVELTADPTGSFYIDRSTGASYASYRYHCKAEDAYLDTLACPGQDLPPAGRTFEDDPTLQALFPDLAQRNGSSVDWTQWEPTGPIHREMVACDKLANCAQRGVDAATQLPPGTEIMPMAVVLSPTDSAIVGSSDGMVDLTLEASSIDPLREWSLTIDGVYFNGRYYAPWQQVHFQRETLHAGLAPGRHTLSASASDWSGFSSNASTTSITVVAAPPPVTISTETIGSDDVYHPGSPMVRFHGTLGGATATSLDSETPCQTTVQIAVGNGPFVDAIVENGEWAAAYFVNAPEGQMLNLKVRATDCAGQMSEASKTIPTQLTVADAPDTEITATPPNPSGAYGVAFAFQAVKGSRDVAGLMCRLDDALFAPCTSPITYNGLSAGQHTFYVRAVDVDGWVDGSPASHTWTSRLQLYLPLISKGRP